ncbi:PTS sugar transporter subunit IIA [Aquamicrobium sp. LC103]|uniref:PTS sugar transporter subunit IIA n=1 Tax=Aquamicrobium sp. LC103 TaxID=1120658 RepID=UPI00063EA15A|nr:PTS sugar transporter subunit IIA [Aquamicrobium sp. LC103]
MLTSSEIFRPEDVAIGVDAPTVKQVLLQAARLLAASSNLPEAEIFKALVDRESLGSTAVGHGVAAPHARIQGAGRAHAVFLRLARPIDFEAGDDRPVDLVCAIIGDYHASAELLRTLAGACRGLRNAETLAKLRQARNSGELYSMLIEESGP